MLIGTHEVCRAGGRWAVDNWWIGGEIVRGTYLLLHDGHEVARGNDPYDLLKVADALNEIEENKVAA